MSDEADSRDPRWLLREQLRGVVIPDGVAQAINELGYTAAEAGVVDGVDESHIRLVLLAMRYADAGVPDELRM